VGEKEETMTTTRNPAVAGQFYPEDPVRLQQMLASYLDEAGARQREGNDVGHLKALVVPHAGYVYSGPIAASAYVRLRPLRDRIRRVVLLGPSHQVPLHGLAVSGADAFRTPLGVIPVDREVEQALCELPQVSLLALAHRYEHSLEVQLPFLQVVLASFSLVPLSVGSASAREVEEVLDQVWGGEETLIVISSDLSHYYEYETAQAMDRETTEAIEALRWDGIGEEGACGRVPLRGLLKIARQKGLSARTLDLRNSGDTAGSRDQVVGYGAYALG